MNEIQLSNDLNVLTTEIFNYQQLGGQVIFEIGKRLKHIKEKDLVHGEWTKYCEKTLKISRVYANKYIKVYEELKDANRNFSFGLNKMYEIATMEDEQREQATTKGIPTDEGYKSIEESTQKEINEYRRNAEEAERRAKQAEQQAKQSKRSEEIARKQLESLEDKEPQVIEKEVIKEVVPEHIKKQMLDREEKLIKTTEKLDNLQEKLELLKKQQSYESDEEKKEKEIKALQYEANKTVLTTKLKMDEFLKDVAITAFRRGAIASSSQGTKENLRQGLDELKNFIKEMELALDGRIEA